MIESSGFRCTMILIRHFGFLIGAYLLPICHSELPTKTANSEIDGLLKFPIFVCRNMEPYSEIAGDNTYSEQAEADQDREESVVEPGDE